MFAPAKFSSVGRMRKTHMTSEPQSLQGDALGLGESIVMGTAGSAPAYSVSATMAALVMAVGVLAPASILYCALIMFGIVFSFQNLNRLDANAGASYSWATKIFSPGIGFIAGWSVMISSILFMVSGTIPAATATLALIAPGLIDNLDIVNLIAGMWVLVIGIIVAKGIKLTSYTQIAFTVIEVGVLLLLIVLAVLKFGAIPAHPMVLAWFSGAGFTPTLFATGALTALFLFAGWDVTSNLNEETRDAQRIAGQGSVWAMVIVTALFLGASVITLLVLSDDEIAAAGTNLLFVVAQKLLPHPWDDVAIIAVMLSTVGGLETSILQFTRTQFAMARAGALHPRYARLHAVYRTPMAATILITALGLLMLLLSSFLPSVNVVIKDSINAIGFQIAIYYGLAGLACAWAYRRDAVTTPRKFILLLAWPLLGAGFLFFIALYSVPTFDLVTNIAGIGGIAIGVVPYLWNKKRLSS